MRTTAGLRFYSLMKYDKRPIGLAQQLDLLKQRGLLVTDEEEALKQLHS